GRHAADHWFVAFEQGQAKNEIPPLPDDLHVAFVGQLLQHLREFGGGGSEVRRRLEERLAEASGSGEEAVRAGHQRQGAKPPVLGNTITSLRLCATLDWSDRIEAASLIEQVLRRDPVGAYGQMDFTSRDRYRHAIEAIAEPTGEAQV